MKRIAPETVSDWLITLYPKRDHPDERVCGGTLETLRDDEEGALAALEGWAQTFERTGVIPDNGGDFRSRSPIAVIRRRGSKCYDCRADCFEFETDAGYFNGGCYLQARRSFEQQRPDDRGVLPVRPQALRKGDWMITVTVEFTERAGKVAEIQVDDDAIRAAGHDPADPKSVYAWLERQRILVTSNGEEAFDWAAAADAAGARTDGYVDDDPMLDCVVLPGGRSS